MQPLLKCSGRQDVVCYYRGFVEDVVEDVAHISFKRFGEKVTEEYDLVKEEFVKEELKDIQIVKK